MTKIMFLLDAFLLDPVDRARIKNINPAAFLACSSWAIASACKPDYAL
jgi:hypothetical protein